MKAHNFLRHLGAFRARGPSWFSQKSHLKFWRWDSYGESPPPGALGLLFGRLAALLMRRTAGPAVLRVFNAGPAFILCRSGNLVIIYRYLPVFYRNFTGWPLVRPFWRSFGQFIDFWPLWAHVWPNFNPLEHLKGDRGVNN